IGFPHSRAHRTPVDRYDRLAFCLLLIVSNRCFSLRQQGTCCFSGIKALLRAAHRYHLPGYCRYRLKRRIALFGDCRILIPNPAVHLPTRTVESIHLFEVEESDAPYGDCARTYEEVRCCASPRGRSRALGTPDRGL